MICDAINVGHCIGQKSLEAELQSGASLSDPANLPKAKDGPKPRIRFHE